MKNLLALDKKITKHIMRNIWCRRTDDVHRVSAESAVQTTENRRKGKYGKGRVACLGRRERSKVVGIKFKK